MQDLIDGLAVSLGDIFVYSGSREVDVLLRRACGETLQEVAADYGITRERIRQVQREAMRYLENIGRWDLINLLGKLKNDSRPITPKQLRNDRMDARASLKTYFSFHLDAFATISYRDLYSALGITPRIPGDCHGIEMGRQIHKDFKPLSRLGTRIWCRGCCQYLGGHEHFSRSVVDGKSSFHYCRRCMALRQRNYIANNRERHDEYRRDYYEKIMTENPDRFRSVQKKYRLRKILGLTGPRKKYL